MTLTKKEGNVFNLNDYPVFQDKKADGIDIIAAYAGIVNSAVWFSWSLKMVIQVPDEENYHGLIANALSKSSIAFFFHLHLSLCE